MQKGAGDDAPPLVVLQHGRRDQAARDQNPVHSGAAGSERREHAGTADFDLPQVRDHVDRDEKPGDHPIMTVRANSSEMACRSPSISIVTGPPSGALSSTRNRTPGRTPTCPR